jgi:uncharacterized protein YjbI with pentapeptide repeats
MANAEHLKILRQGVTAWNAWREKEPEVKPDLREAKLREADLFKVDLTGADLCGADLRRANLGLAGLFGADLSEADLSEADFSEADLRGANLTEADLSEAHLFGTNLRGADLSGATLIGASLINASLVETTLTDVNLAGCHIYGISAWKLELSPGTKQQDLVITDVDEPEITVDDIEVAQFVYLLLHNEKIRRVIDTIGKKAVLILGRFTEERIKVLDALRNELRKHDYLPILFDFDKPASKDLTGTVLALAHMARFIIADLTDPSCIPYEVSKVADAFVPIQPILLSGKSEFAMFVDMQRRYHWVLATHRYDTQEQLIAGLDEWVIRPAEAKVLELRGAKLD